MAYDFRANQVRLNRIISSGSIPILIYPSSSAADLAGLSAGDVIMAVDGIRVTSQLDKQLASYVIGDSVNIHFFRRDELMQLSVKLLANQADQCTLTCNTEYKMLIEKWVLG